MTLGARAAVDGERLGAGCGRDVIFSCHRIPADPEHLLKHAGSIDQRIDAGATAVSPGDWNLLNFKSELAGKKKNLRIESPALDLLKRKYHAGGRLFESLESALRVFELQAERDAKQQVEDAAEELAVQRLALSLRFGAQPARSDRNVRAAVEGIEELRSFFDWR